jgi:peptide/nickel transport system substrate-binding protein
MKLIRTLSCLTLLIGLASCGGDANDGDDVLSDPNELSKVEGGKFEGGVLRLNSIEDYTSLFPAAINDIYSTHIASQGYEGLLRLNQKTLEVEPCLAESFDIDKDKKTYTFHLRKGVMFIDDECFENGKGREVNANDFKYCFEFLCSNNSENKWTSLFRDRLVGANEYADGSASSVAGINVIDDYTLELELINPFSGFPNLLTILAAAVYPQEAIDAYGHDGMHNKIVGSGPFIPTLIENGSQVTFEKNPNYWRKDDFGNQMPFLNQINFTFIKDKNAELKAFQDDELDILWGIPVEEIQNIMGSLEEAKDGLNKEFEVQSINSLNVQYYGFLYTSEVFSDVRVRQAFNYAVDRDSLTSFVLQGEGSPAHNGFVPEMSGYPSETVTGFDYNPEKAKKLMKEAGFPGGKGFPEITLNLNASGGVNEKIADAITYMLNKNLGVNIALNVIPMSELHPKVERGEVDFWRFGWIADYPDPSNFLYLFHGKNIIEGKESSINYFRYSNPAFDKVYEEALVEIDTEKRMKLYAQADQILMDDAVIMPLFFNIDIRLINPDVQDFDINEMEYRDLSVVYYKKTNRDNVRVYDNLEAEEDTVE